MPWTAADARARYQRLKAARKCIRCAAGLQDADGVECLECAEEHRDRVDARAQTRAGKRARARIAHRLRERRKSLGLCVWCLRAARPGTTKCEHHHHTSKVSRADYLDRKERDAMALDAASLARSATISNPPRRPAPDRPGANGGAVAGGRTAPACEAVR